MSRVLPGLSRPDRLLAGSLSGGDLPAHGVSLADATAWHRRQHGSCHPGFLRPEEDHAPGAAAA